MATRESGRIKETERKRVLDDAARKRRQRKALEALERDNSHDDPHADWVINKKVPKFKDNLDTSVKKKRKAKAKTPEYYKLKYRKAFVQILEEEKALWSEGEANYLSAKVGPSDLPARKFCAVCGFFSNYVCTSCGTRYCSVRCLGTHKDTRCLKWTA